MSATTTARVDMHVRIFGERVVSRTKACGIDVLVYALHFVRLPDARIRTGRFSGDDLFIVPAHEVFAGSWHDRKHAFVVGFSNPVPDFITLDGAFAEFNRQDAATLVPHPTFLTVSLTAEDMTAHRDDVDAVKAYDTKALPRGNRRGRDTARETGLPGFTSSYTHLRGTAGETWTEFDRDIDSEANLVAALHEGAERRVVRRADVSHRSRGATKFAYLDYENSWGKIDRLLLLGMEPTHPDRIAYDGQFGDVSVY